MPTPTTHYNLQKPDTGQPGWAGLMNTNLDNIDAALNNHETRIGTLETGGGVGSHAATHATGGTDPLTPAAIGAASAAHGHNSLTGTGDITGYNRIEARNFTGVTIPDPAQSSGFLYINAPGNTNGMELEYNHSARWLTVGYWNNTDPDYNYPILVRFPANTAQDANIGLNTGTAESAFGAGQGVIAIGEASTVPTGNPTGAIYTYVEGGLLKYRSPNGTIHTLRNSGVRVTTTDAYNATAPIMELLEFSAGTGLSVGTTSGPNDIQVQYQLDDTAVTPGTYTNANITVDQQGRITAASTGTGGGGGGSAPIATSTTTGTVRTDTSTADPVVYLQGSVDTLLAGKAGAVHTHDDRYYTEAETDALLGGKAATSHTHAIADTTGLQAALDGKSNTNHTHAYIPPRDVSVSFTANGDAYYVAPESLTLAASPQEAGTGTLAYAVALAASQATFSGTTLPVTLAQGDVLRITVSGISGYKAVTLRRSA